MPSVIRPLSSYSLLLLMQHNSIMRQLLFMIRNNCVLFIDLSFIICTPFLKLVVALQGGFPKVLLLVVQGVVPSVKDCNGLLPLGVGLLLEVLDKVLGEALQGEVVVGNR